MKKLRHNKTQADLSLPFFHASHELATLPGTELIIETAALLKKTVNTNYLIVVDVVASCVRRMLTAFLNTFSSEEGMETNKTKVATIFSFKK